MARALALAQRGRRSARPNPAVGCVLVRDGIVVGEGWHARAGEPHAEIHALRGAGERARGAVCYVTLEPCSHHGRTPPCVDALLAAGVARVVAALRDPNPRVAGGGLARLAAAGIDIDCGLLEAPARALNRGFVQRMERGRPWLRAKVGASLDGRTAMATGESRWITSADARRDVHRLRAESGAVITGIGTVLADDPELTARVHGFDLVAGQPLRAVLDSRLRLPPAARLLAAPGATVIYGVHADAGRRAALEAGGAQVVLLPGGETPAPDAVLRDLAAREVNDALLEAGPGLTGAFLEAGVVDELVLYIAPRLLGDAARGLARLPGLARLADAPAFRFADVTRVGPDLRVILVPDA